MSKSTQEEALAALWIICSLLAVLNGYVIGGWLFGIKGGLDFICSLYYGVKEVAAENSKEVEK